jgi:hypothetical protein
VLAFTPTALTFGPVDSGATTPAQQLTLTNIGGSRAAALTVTLGGTDPARFNKGADTCSGANLRPSGSCTLSFSYTPSVSGASDTAMITVTPRKQQGSVTAAVLGTSNARSNTSPVMNGQAFETYEDAPLLATIAASDADGDALSFRVISGPGHGSLVFGTTPGAFTYTPVANYAGADVFSVSVRDTGGATATARMTMTVFPVNDAPVAVDDAATTTVNKPVAIPVLSNDFDIEGDLFRIRSFSQPAHGSVTVNPQLPSQLIFTPFQDDCVASDEFSYQAEDLAGTLVSNTATVTITMLCP